VTRKYLVNREQRLLARERDVKPDDLNSVKLEYELAGTAAAEVAAHVALANPHTQYLLESAFTWANIGSKPTTISGFGITDAVTTSGNQTIGGEKTFSTFVKSESYFDSRGTLSGYQFFDRGNTSKSWVWYSSGGFCYLYRGFGGAANVLSIDDTNNILSDIYGRVRSVPLTAQNANYTFTVQDIGRCRAKTDTTARTYTVDNSIFTDGDVLTVLNDNSTADITIAAGAGVTLYLAGTTTTGNRTVAPRGMATIYMRSASVGYVSGPGVT
jgi:hypothetical protein